VNYRNDHGYLPPFFGANTESHAVRAEGQGRACVLALHRVVDRVERPHDVRWSTFWAIVDMVLRSGRKADTQLEPDAVRPATVVFTFDDGTSDHLDVAQELATKELPGLFFLSTSTLGEPGYIERSDARQIAEMGHVIGSHGVRHDPLDTYTDAGLLEELRGSKETLEDLLQSEVRYFAPPGGSWAPALARSLEQCGYTASRSMRWGMHSAMAPRWAVPVVPVTELTYSRGWISHALKRDRLPLAMRSVGFAKGLLPLRARAFVSQLAHRW
jgi:peptidoglycan/xylan/chitin deacetylase (PgdA/CDA1 family)